MLKLRKKETWSSACNDRVKVLLFLCELYSSVNVNSALQMFPDTLFFQIHTLFAPFSDKKVGLLITAVALCDLSSSFLLFSYSTAKS